MSMTIPTHPTPIIWCRSCQTVPVAKTGERCDECESPVLFLVCIDCGESFSLNQPDPQAIMDHTTTCEDADDLAAFAGFKVQTESEAM